MAATTGREMGRAVRTPSVSNGVNRTVSATGVRRNDGHVVVPVPGGCGLLESV